MSRPALVRTLEASLQDAATRLDHPGDLERMLDLAALDFVRVRPRVLRATLTLVPGQADYPAPAGCLELRGSQWTMDKRSGMHPWDAGWPGPEPHIALGETEDGRRIFISPTPGSAQIAALGAEFPYSYRVAHQIGNEAADTSIVPGDGWLLILRAQAEAMKELALRGATKPVRLRDGQTQGTRNGTPAALCEQLMKQFEARIAA